MRGEYLFVSEDGDESIATRNFRIWIDRRGEAHRTRRAGARDEAPALIEGHCSAPQLIPSRRSIDRCNGAVQSAPARGITREFCQEESCSASAICSSGSGS